MKVLVVAAHADDECLGPGATVARHVANGDDVVVVIAADCRAARVAVTPSLLPAAVKAAHALGVKEKIRFLGFRAMQLNTRELELNKEVGYVVNDFKPGVVYTHHWGDLNSDHQAVSRAVMVAMRPSGKSQQVLCFETPSSTEWAHEMGNFRPNYFVDVTATIEKKLAAMACYEEELREPPHPRALEALRTRAAYWGQVAGCQYAEAFVLAREVVK